MADDQKGSPATIRLTVDGRPVTAREGDSVLEAARAAGVIVPTLCWHPDLSVDGSCRLCVVEIEGMRLPATACSTPASEGMIVRTETPALAESRRFVLGMLLTHYADAGYAAGDRDETEFTHWLRRYGVRIPGAAPPILRDRPNSDPNPFVWVDWNKCILCTRCVRACAEIQGRFVWSVGYRGAEARIIAGLDTTMLEARCESCGACAAYCPTGALDDKPSVGLGRPEKTVGTTCGYCGVGCSVDLDVKDNRIVRARSSRAAAVNGMHLCVKGRYGYDYVHHPERLARPRVRRYLLEGGTKRSAAGGALEWVETDWRTALGLVAEKLVAVRRESGPQATGFLASAKCTNEENYLVQKLARQAAGTNNVDHCARLCHSSTVAGLAAAFGSGAMSNSMDDVAREARALLIIGSNTTEQHPVFASRIRQAVLRRGVKLVVADPRRIDIAELAALHLRQRPGTDVALLNGIMRIVLENGWHDHRFVEERCENFAEFRATIEKYRPELASEITGVSREDLYRAAEILARNRPMAVIWGMGITQHTTGVLNVLSLANLQMLLGNMGVAGGGVNPLRGQNNVQGACDMGALPNLFPGYQPVTDAGPLGKFGAAWALDDGRALDARPGLTVTEMVEAYGAGTLRFLYVLGEDLAMTEPDIAHARRSLASGEFLALQEIFPSETAAFADVLLPGVSFAEKKGTFTNTERRVQMVRPAVDPPGEARQDWEIVAGLARLVLEIEGRRPAGPRAGWGYRDTAEIMDEIAALTPSYSGVSHSRLERGESLQWPVRDRDHPGTPILHVGQFARGRGRFHAVDHLPPAELPDKDYPFVLTTGRVLYHWHGGELSRRAKGLLEVYPESLVEISAEDAARIGLNGDRLLRLRSRRGEVLARPIVTDRVAPGILFGNFHFPGEHNINNLTIRALDPVAKIPEYKVCAVAIEAAD
ncbi:MAG TPA: formate dehydrogenase subunit alpha [candidate division Zixibacteria bacterium]|nr:formate dehydrogenase subunit alpha [candidate division Zixibacteria bacterium]